MARDTKKKCLNCGSPDLQCMVSLTKLVPLADKSGTVKIGGQKISQVDIKDAWDYEGGNRNRPRVMRGPIFCLECETEHYYSLEERVLKIGNAEEAQRLLKERMEE